MQAHVLTGHDLTPRDVVTMARRRTVVSLGAEARAAMGHGHDLAEAAAQTQQLYGRNTGVGANRDMSADGSGHGERLVASHVTTGPTPYPADVVRAALLVRVNQLACGGSGLPPAVADAMIDVLNRGELPELHRGAALGTGDIGSLAELAVALGDALDDRSGLAVLSSNAVTLAECCFVAVECRALIDVVPIVGALTLAALRGNREAFDSRVHEARPHRGQAAAAARMRGLLEELPIEEARVQDPFGLRAFPQVSGPAVEIVDELDRLLEIDLNAATENPLVTEYSALHNGNWHLMPIALRLDSLRLALHSVAALSASRLGDLLDPGVNGLSRFLASGPAGSSGALMVEYVAQDALASLRLHAHPATLGTTTLSQGAENHASFAPQAARQATRLLDDLRTVLACELVAACRALTLAGVTSDELRPAGVAAYLGEASQALPQDLDDRALRGDIATARDLLARWSPAS